MADLATLGVDIDASGAISSLTQLGDALDRTGTQGGAAAQKVETAGDRVTKSIERQYKSLREAQQAWIAEANAIKSTVAATEISAAEFARADAAFKAMTNSLRAAEPATSAVTTAMARTAEATNAVTFPLGRLRQSFSSLTATMTGTPAVVDRIISTLGSFAIGNEWMIGILAGAAALGAAWRFLHKDADDLAESAKKATDELRKMVEQKNLGVSADLKEKLFGSAADHPQGGGGLTQQVADDREKLAKAIRDLPYQTDFRTRDQKEAQIIELQNQLNRDLALRKAAMQLIHEAEVQHTAQIKDDEARQLADLIKHHTATAAERQRALALYKTDLAALRALQQEQPKSEEDRRRDLTAQENLQRPIDALQDALYPRPALAVPKQMDASIDSFRRLTDQAHALIQSLDGADRPYQNFLRTQESLDLEMTKLNQVYSNLQHPTAAQTALIQAQRQEYATLVPQIQAAGEAFRQQRLGDVSLEMQKIAAAGDPTSIVNVTVAVDEAQKHVRDLSNEFLSLHQNMDPSQLGTLLDALDEWDVRVVRVARETAEANVELARARELISQIQVSHETGTSAPVDELTRLNALYQEIVKQQASLTQGTTAWKTLQEAINAILKERSLVIASPVTSASRDLIGQVEEHRNLGTGDLAADLQHVNAAIVDAQDLQIGLNKDADEYRIIQASINALLRERKVLLGDMAKSEHELARIAEEVVRGLATVVNEVTAASGHQVSPQLGDVEGIATNATAAIASKGTDIGADIGTVVDSIKLVGDIFNANAAAIQEQKQIQRENTAALVQMTLKLQGFIANSADNLDKARRAVAAFDATPAAVQQLDENKTHYNWVGRQQGNLQTQINALQPFLDAVGLTWDQFKQIAQSENWKLFDDKGRIVTQSLTDLATAADTAARAAFTLSKSFSEQQTVFALENSLKGQTDARAQYDAAIKAFGVALGGSSTSNAALFGSAGLANPLTAAGLATDNSLQAENQMRRFLLSEVQQVEAGTLDYKKLGNFSSLQEFLSAVQAITSPLNELTNTVNGVNDSLTNIPSGFKVAYDKFLASDRLTQAPGTPPPASVPTLGHNTGTLPTSYPITPAGLTGSSFTAATGLRPGDVRAPVPMPPAPTVQQPTVGAVYNIQNMTVTTTATNGKELLKQLEQEVQSQSGRGGTTPMSLYLGGGSVRGGM